MAHYVRDIDQHFYCSQSLPYLTLRSTSHSLQGYKSHCHPTLSIGIITSGMTCLSMGEQSIILHEGDVIVIEPDKVHACNPVDGQPRSYYMLYVDRARCCEILSALYGHPIQEFVCTQPVRPCSDETRKLIQLIGALLDQESLSIATDVACFIFETVSRYCLPLMDTDDEHSLALKLRARLLQDRNPPSLAILAGEMGVSTAYLIRHFKQHFSITPKSFLNNSRVEKAKLLLKSGMSIVDVAMEVGFSDQSQLHHAFVNYTASTPGQFQAGMSIFDKNR